MKLNETKTYKDFKETDIYRNAVVVELFSSKTGIEFNDDFPEEKLDEMIVDSYSILGGWITLNLKEVNIMSAERKQELLNNMEEYLVNYSNDINFEEIGATEETELNEAFDNCLSYIVELVGNNGNKYFFENVLGFTKEELLNEGMEWLYN